MNAQPATCQRSSQPGQDSHVAPRNSGMRPWTLGVLAAALAVITIAAEPQQPAPVPPSPGPAGAPQPSEIGVRITGDPGAPPRYAVPDFVSLSPEGADIAKTLGQVLWDDLNFEREMYMLPRDTYSSVPAARTVEEVPFPAWRELGADAVVFGSVQQKGDDVTVQVRLLNVRSRDIVFAKEYSGNARNPRRYAHTIADEIHKQQRALRGVALTRLTFSSDRNRERLIGTVQNREVKEIYVADYDGANAQRITTSRQLNINPSWSPDARAIAYTSYKSVEPDIFVSFIYQGVLQNPTKGQSSNFLPVYSPDGARMAFASNRDGNMEIYTMNADGANVRRLTNHPAGDITPTWSPSGTEIAFTSDRGGRPQIYVMSADGSNLRRLPTNESEADRATWAPAPYTEIAYSARTGAGYDIKIYDLASGQSRQITFGEGTNESPAYAPNGRHIAFTSTRFGRVHIFTIGRDGSGLRQVTREGNNFTPAWSN
jgi:TolB protein